MTVTNTDPEIVGWCSQWGGKVYWNKREGTVWKEVGTWRIGGAVDVFHCLFAITPYLLGAKRSRAMEATKLLKGKYSLRELPDS